MLRLSRVAASLILSASTLAVMPGLVAAQEQAASLPGIEAKFAATRITVDFPGGTLQEYLAAIRAAAKPAPINTVAPPHAMQAQLGPIQLRDVNILTALMAIQPAAGEINGRWMVKSISAGQAPDGSTEAFGIDYFPTPGMNPTLKDSFPGDTDQGAPKRIQVYSLKNVIEPLSSDSDRVVENPEVVLTAIQAALELSTVRGHEPPEVKFHADSGLLVVRGTTDQLRLVNESIDQMASTVRQRRQAGATGINHAMRLEELRAEVEIAQVELMEREKALESGVRRLDFLGAQHEAGTIPVTDVERAKAEVDSLRASLEKARIEARKITARAQLQERAMRERSAPGGKVVVAVYDIADFGDKANVAIASVNAVVHAWTASNPGGPAPKVEVGQGRVAVEGPEAVQSGVQAVIQELRKNALNRPAAPGNAR